MNEIICIHEYITLDIDYHIEKVGSTHPLSEDPPGEYIEITKSNMYLEIDNLKIDFSYEQSKKYFERFENEIFEALGK